MFIHSTYCRVMKGRMGSTNVAPTPTPTPIITIPPIPTPPTPPVTVPTPPPAPVTWQQNVIANGTKVTEDEWLVYESAKLGYPSTKYTYTRFVGKNNCTAWGYAPGGTPVETSIDSLGQPLITNSSGGAIVVVSWNMYIYLYQGTYYDLLSYFMSQTSSPGGV